MNTSVALSAEAPGCWRPGVPQRGAELLYRQLSRRHGATGERRRTHVLLMDELIGTGLPVTVPMKSSNISR